MGKFAICKFGRCGASYDADDPRARDGLCPYCAMAQEQEETGATGSLILTQPTMPSGKPPDPRRWGWCQEGDENAAGPFDSRVEAIEHAIEQLLDECGPGTYEICIGRCDYPDPAKYASLFATKKEMGDLMYEMDEAAYNDCMCEDQIFCEREGAAEAFEKAITEWASQFLYADCWVLTNDEKLKIKVRDE